MVDFWYEQDERVKRYKSVAILKASGNGERNVSVYEENLRRLISEVLKHKMILLTTRHTKETL